MRIILIDDHQILIEGISQLLENSHEVVAIFSEPVRALEFLKANPVDLVIVDYEMPQVNGIEFFLEAKKYQPYLKGIVLSMHDEPAVVRRALKEGLNGFLLKNVGSQELHIALEKIAKGYTYISAELNNKLLQKINEPLSFSARELQVLRLIIKEFPNKQIADKLFLSERTVETYRKNLFRKANTNNIVGLIKYAFAHNLVK